MRAAPCKVQVAYLTLSASGHLLMLKTDSIFSIHRASPTAPSGPPNGSGLQLRKVLYEHPRSGPPPETVAIDVFSKRELEVHA